MNRLKSLEIKRLLKELDFIESDFEYRNLVVSEADSEFINSINEFLKSHPELKKIYDDKVTEKINQSIEKTKQNSEKEIESIEEQPDSNDTEDQKDESIDIEKNEEKAEDKKHIQQLKKLYREIVKLTHPDKVKNTKLNEIYLKSTNYYESGNKIGLYSICDELNIEYEIDEYDVILISENISEYKNKINFLESTFTWKWYNCEDEAMKNQIMIEYIKLKIR